jgi:hypothetical protein
MRKPNKTKYRPKQDTPGEKKKKKTGKPLPEITEKIETGGPKGPEPTRYGDWERKGRAIDF